MNAPRPQKRLPEEIYMRRRVAAVVVVVVVIILIVWLISALSGGDKNTDTTPAGETTSTSAQADTTKESAPKDEASTSEKDKAEKDTSDKHKKDKDEPKNDKNASCSLTDLIIEARTDRAEYSGEQQPKFFMAVKNPTKADCEIDLSEQQLRYEVYDLQTSQRVWADIDCNAPEDDSEKVFKAGEETYYEAQWSKTSSAPGACDSREPMPAGSYFLHTIIGDNASDPVTFNLN